MDEYKYKDIVAAAAKRKLIDQMKSFLDIIDELRKEEVAKIDSLIAVAEANGIGSKINELRPFLFLFNDGKKEILRKRILDQTNSLIRELES